MNILATETSCDETAISIITASGGFRAPRLRIRANVVLSQIPIHAEFGGVFPAVAKREHAKNLVPILIEALKDAKMLKKSKAVTIDAKTNARIKRILEREAGLYEKFIKFVETTGKPDIDALAITYGPGLEPALWVGISFVRALSIVWDIPIIPINHMEGHIFSSLVDTRLKSKTTIKKVQFPALALLISGGHTELVLMKDWLSYKIIGATLDDAVGEAFDKVARMMDLPYPGGPEISKIAVGGTPGLFPLPRPMLRSGDSDFSFSGLKTAVLYTIKKLGKLTKEQKADIAREFEEAATEVLTNKTLRVLEKKDCKTLVLGGGVTANKRIRERFQDIVAEKYPDALVHIPDSGLSTDNALMIAVAAYFRYTKLRSKVTKKPGSAIRANGNLCL